MRKTCALFIRGECINKNWLKFHGLEDLKLNDKSPIKIKAVKIEEPEEFINYTEALKFFDTEELIKNKLIDKREMIMELIMKISLREYAANQTAI
jgi:hypothetical protein